MGKVDNIDLAGIARQNPELVKELLTKDDLLREISVLMASGVLYSALQQTHKSIEQAAEKINNIAVKNAYQANLKEARGRLIAWHQNRVRPDTQKVLGMLRAMILSWKATQQATNNGLLAQ